MKKANTLRIKNKETPPTLIYRLIQMRSIFVFIIVLLFQLSLQGQHNLYYKVHAEEFKDDYYDVCRRYVQIKVGVYSNNNYTLLKEQYHKMGRNCDVCQCRNEIDINYNDIPKDKIEPVINLTSKPESLEGKADLERDNSDEGNNHDYDKSTFDYVNYKIITTDLDIIDPGQRGVFKADFVAVDKFRAAPIIETENVFGEILATNATFRAPDFIRNNFLESDIEWTFTRSDGLYYQEYGSRVNFAKHDFYCQPAKVTVRSVSYNWISEETEFTLKPMPNIQLEISSPLCTEVQKNGNDTKALGKIELKDGSLNREFKVNYSDKDDKPVDELTLDKIIPVHSLDPIGSPYTFKIEEKLGVDVYSCPLYINKINVVYPKPITITDTAFTDINCFGQKPKIGITISGNTNTYLFNYEDSSKTIIADQASFIPLMTQTRNYEFTIIDANGCKFDQPLNFTATEPTKLEATLQIDTALCFRGNASVQILAIGGTAYDTSNPYRYAFWPATGTQTSPIFATKGGASVYPRVYDKNNCSFSFPTTTLSNPKDFKLKVIEHVDNICPKASLGKVILGSASEDQSYTYTYSIAENTFNKDSSFDSLSANTYKLTVQNQNGCKKDTSLTITQPPLIEINKIGLDSVRCFGDQNGTITLNVTGGTGTKKLWMDGGQQIGQPQGLQPYTYDGLADRTYKFYAQDSLGCVDSMAYAIGTRSKIQHTSSMIKPSCFESNNGQLEVYTYGGKAPYNHTWVDRPELGTSLKQTQLTKGTYVLLSTDLLSCVKRDTFTLEAPPALQVDLQGYPMMCKGQVAELDAGTDGSRYEWESNNGFSSNARKVSIGKAGKYWVTIKDYNNCIGSDTIILQQSDTELKADFLVATNVVKGDTVVLVNINPIIDSIKWNINPDYMVSVGKNLNRTTERVVFTSYGENYVEMEGYYKGCRDIRRHRVFVIDVSERNKYDKAIGIKTSIINTCHLFPNPNDGSFEVEFELNEKGIPIAVTLSSMATGTVLKTADWKVYPDGKVKFEEDLPEGAYVIHVKARDEVIALRFLVAYD